MNCYFCFGIVLFSVPTRLGLLVADPLWRRPVFDLKSVHLSFVADKGAQWQDFTQLLWCLPVSVIPTCTILTHLPPTLFNAFLIVVPFPLVSFIPPMYRTHFHVHVSLTSRQFTVQGVGLFLSPSSRHAARKTHCGKVRHYMSVEGYRRPCSCSLFTLNRRVEEGYRLVHTAWNHRSTSQSSMFAVRFMAIYGLDMPGNVNHWLTHQGSGEARIVRLPRPGDSADLQSGKL
jgi:hypothetical protein